MKILWIDIDTLRADRLGCYGCDRGTSPNIDRIAREGYVFTRAYTANSPCVPSRAAFASGHFGVRNGILTHPGPGAWLSEDSCGRNGSGLFTRPLQRKGLRTASVSSFFKHDDGRETQWFRYAFDENFDPHWERRCQADFSCDVNRFALPWLERHRDEDFFLHLHYWDPHTPYNLPPEVHEPFLSNPPWAWPTREMKKTHLARFRAFGPQRFGFRRPEEIDAFLNKYDAQIHDTDRHLGEVFNRMASLGILDETLIGITADHGEQFGECGVYGDHCVATQANNRVPLVVRLPGRIRPGLRSDAPVYSQDLVPTWWEHAGAKGVPSDFSSLWPLLSGRRKKTRDYLVSDHGLYTASRMVLEGDWALRLVYNCAMFGYDVLPPVSLFNLAKDPHEEHDLVGKHPEIARKIYRRMESWRTVLGITDTTDPLRQLGNAGPRTYEFPGFFLNLELNQRGITRKFT
ncbi:MAG: sulfatase-like hydrolase/transferase [Planctomycetota bacterium]